MDANLMMQQFTEFSRNLGDDIIAWARPEGWGPGVTQVSLQPSVDVYNISYY